MLFTRCPHCDTIFRVTDHALAKAGGRVRCGRCANVFDATADLRESPDGAAITRPTAAAAAAAPASTARAVTPAEERTTEPLSSSATGAGAPGAEGRRREVIETSDDRARGKRDATGSAVTQAPRTTAPAAAGATSPVKPPAGTAAAETITPAEIDEVLAGARANAAEAAPVELEIAALRPQRRGASAWWRAAAAVALVALVAQGVHYFREDLVVSPAFGPLLARAYGAFGVDLHPRWSVEQYRILDSAMTAAMDDTGTWKVRVRFVNDGPHAQPYPLIHLELKDRWQETVRSRRFTPAEYLPPELPSNRLMRPDETAQAALEILDPGPDVSGFELDVCLEVETNLISCGKDEPFL